MAANYPYTITIEVPSVRDAIIYYTIDGTDPTEDDELYEGPFQVYAPTDEIRSFATHPAYSDSDIAVNSTFVPPDTRTSKPYPTRTQEELEVKDFDITEGVFRSTLRGYTDGETEDLEVKDFDITAGVFKDIFREYTDGETEDLEIKDFDITAGVFKDIFIEYTDGETEDLEIKDFDVTAGVFKEVLITYSNGETEDLEIKDFDITGGVFESP